jgi:LEA14-like dessication related protein
MNVRFSLALLLIILFQSCSYDKSPDFVAIKDVKVKKLTAEEIIISANALYFNPNDIGCTLTNTDVEVLIDGLVVGHVNQTNNVELDAKSNFKIPLTISFPAKKVFQDTKKILGNLAGLLGTKDVEIQYKGVITIDVLGIAYSSDFDHSEKMALKVK